MEMGRHGECPSSTAIWRCYALFAWMRVRQRLSPDTITAGAHQPIDMGQSGASMSEEVYVALDR
jgi:hypothetical protein